MIFGREIAVRVIALAVGGIVIIALSLLLLSQCDKRHSQAAQTRVERTQAEAASNSAADAVSTVARSGEAAAASEELTRQNSGEIHAAPGANDRVNSGVDLAGRKALCKRAAYRDDPRCAPFRRQQ